MMKKNNGMTLAEAVVSIALLAFVWIATFNMVVSGKAAESRSRHKIQAVYAIQQAIETLRRTTYSSIASSGPTTISLDTKGTDSTADDFTASRQITVTSPSTYYKKVVVAVTWKETLWGKTRNVTEYGGTFISNDPQAN